MYNGIINVYKEKGFTSHDVVAKLRGILKMKKIGHTGTLDPDAEGVLPICVGKATKLCEFLLEKSKTYRAVVLLGIVTDTQDVTGTVLEEHEKIVSRDKIVQVIESFVGGYDQIPPMYSALKVNGKKLYEYARQGIEVERKSRFVKLDKIDILDISDDLMRITIDVHCSKGTYIRTLCHDIGEKLGCGACMESLLRTQVEQYSLDEALKLSDIEELVQLGKMDNHITKIEDILASYPKVTIKKQAQKLLLNGNKFDNHSVFPQGIEEDVRVYDVDGTFIALYTYDKKKKEYKPLKMF